MINFNYLVVLYLITSVNFSINNIEIHKNRIDFSLMIDNNTNQELIFYKPTKNSMKFGIFNVMISESISDDIILNLNRNDEIYDIDEIYLNENNSIILKPNEKYEKKFSFDCVLEKNKYNLIVEFLYQDVNFNLSYLDPFGKIYIENIFLKKAIRIE